MMIGVSAHTGEGIDALLDAITLTAEILEFSAATQGPAQGPSLSILLIATIMGALALFACLIDSIVCGITPSSAATTKITMSVVLAPNH
jgi:hypothetical protein